MMLIQPVAYAASLFLALTCLLRWTHRRNAAYRLQRSLGGYLVRRSCGPAHRAGLGVA